LNLILRPLGNFGSNKMDDEMNWWNKETVVALFFK